MDTAEPVSRVLEALESGQLSLEDLTARRLSAFLGKTTSMFYHHWGSLEGFLFAVQQLGFAQLGQALTETLEQEGAEAMADAFVVFGLEHRALYHLMFERQYNWEALRAAGTFQSELPGLAQWGALVAYFACRGADDPDGDARLLYAGLHGLVSLAVTGRANVGALEQPDRVIARQLARRLVQRLVPS